MARPTHWWTYVDSDGTPSRHCYPSQRAAAAAACSRCDSELISLSDEEAVSLALAHGYTIRREED